MQIKQFAAKYKLTTDTVRFYEKEGLLIPKRQENGYRIYDLECEKNIKFILVLRQIGFTLQEIKQLLTLEEKPISANCNQQTVQLFATKIASIEKQMVFFQQALQSLQLARSLMLDGNYEENIEEMSLQIDRIYESLQEGREDNVST